MKSWCLHIAFLLLILCVCCACGDRGSSTNTEPSNTNASASTPVSGPVQIPIPAPSTLNMPPRTVILYMAGDNSLSFLLKTNGESGDFAEILAGAAQLDASLLTTNNVLIFADKSDELFLPTIWRLEKSSDGKAILEEVKKFDSDVLSTDPALIKEVIDFAKTYYPANSYGFVYWSHGDGWQYIGIDQQNGTLKGEARGKTTISGLADALSSIGKKFDFVMFDACYMLSIEVAYELRNCTKYIVASPTETPGPGAPYDTMLAVMLAEDNVPDAMGEAFFEYYNQRYDEDNNSIPTNDSWHGGVTVGVVDCGVLEALAKATAEGLEGVTDIDNVLLREAIFPYDRRNFVDRHYNFDMVDLMKSLMKENDYAMWLNVYQHALVAWHTTSKYYSSASRWFSMETAHGITHYIPKTNDISDSMDIAYHATSWYKDAGLSQLGW
ncbi:MAG: hypothetical protein J6S94_01080 [Bacteroidaceae bacterium]|nr:hypothetical protein [Bacteroidaceae bacterium]